MSVSHFATVLQRDRIVCVCLSGLSPQPERVFSGPGWHSVGRQAHSMAGSHSEGQWPQTRDTTREMKREW